MLCAGSRGGSGGGGRYAPVDERALFERLWRGALCQALGDKGPLSGPAARLSSARRMPPHLAQPAPQCCCHCHCLRIIGTDTDHNNATTLVLKKPNAKTMRSVVRYANIHWYWFSMYYFIYSKNMFSCLSKNKYVFHFTKLNYSHKFNHYFHIKFFL